MRLRDHLRQIVESGQEEQLEDVIAEERRSVRYLVGMTYHSDPKIRSVAARGLALAARHYPERIEELLRRLAQDMDDKGGTNAVHVPHVIDAIAAERPDFLLPLVPQLIRAAADPLLQPGLALALRKVNSKFPGEVGQQLNASLREKLLQGDDCA